MITRACRQTSFVLIILLVVVSKVLAQDEGPLVTHERSTGQKILRVAVLGAVASNNPRKDYTEGIEAYEKKNYEKAINSFKDFLDRNLRAEKIDVDAHYYLALSFYKTGSYTASIREFEEALRLQHPNVFNIHWFMANAYTRLLAYQYASESLSKAIITGDKKAENMSNVHAERAKVYIKLNKSSLAIEDAEASLKYNPKNEAARQILDAQRSTAASEPSSTVTTAPVATQQSDDEDDLAKMFEGEKRYALVVGNASYQHVAPLKNSMNDASDIAEELTRSNFEVIKVIDGTYEQIRSAFIQFHQKLSNGPKDKTVGVFYYAGHGLQTDGENYIVPIDANIQYEDDIPRTCVPIQRVILNGMDRSSSRMNIVILDACRNNPFPSASRSAGSGLAEMKKAKGSFIAYATAPGSTASDGDGRNGLYTQELLKALGRKGRSIEQVFKEVRKNVLELSQGKQNTWDSSNIIGEFYFKY